MTSEQKIKAEQFFRTLKLTPAQKGLVLAGKFLTGQFDGVSLLKYQQEYLNRYLSAYPDRWAELQGFGSEYDIALEKRVMRRERQHLAPQMTMDKRKMAIAAKLQDEYSRLFSSLCSQVHVCYPAPRSEIRYKVVRQQRTYYQQRHGWYPSRKELFIALAGSDRVQYDVGTKTAWIGRWGWVKLRSCNCKLVYRGTQAESILDYRLVTADDPILGYPRWGGKLQTLIKTFGRLPMYKLVEGMDIEGVKALIQSLQQS